MFRALIIAAPMVVASLTVVPVASPALAWQNGNAQCGNSEERRARGRGIGGMLGGMARGLGGRMGGVAGMVMNNVPVAEMLGEAIASLLDQCEQQKAAVATDEALRGGVGTSVEWQSDTRPGVTGRSEVTAREQETGGGDCMTVTDIVIVDGEETRAPKRMCRRPPSTRYVRV
jgi:surface antigen